MSIFRPLVGEPVRLHSPLTPEAIMARLTEAFPMSLRSVRGVRGVVTTRRLKLSIETDPRTRNSWRPLLFAGLAVQGQGTLIDGQFRTNRVGQAFTLVWPLAGILIGGRDNLLSTAGLLLFGAALMTVGLWWTRNDKAQIEDILHEVIGATPA